MDAENELAHLGAIVSEGMVECSGFEFKNLEGIKIEPGDIPLSATLYRGRTYIIYPSNPAKRIEAVGSRSKQGKALQHQELGIARYFPNAFSKDGTPYNILVLFQHPLEHYLKCLEREVFWFPPHR